MEKENLNFQIYQIDNESEINALIKDETIWLTQRSMSDLFDVGQPAIAKHLKNIFESQELQESAVYSKMEYTATDGKKYKTGFYNLDAIISVGYRVNSQKATRFRQWATKILKEFMIKGFVLDDERLKQGERIFNQDYFQELLERVRSIRASERRVWQKVTDIFAEISSDYDKDSDVTKRFYALVQNKFHYAITGETAAEIIKSRANHKNANMGLTTWKNSPDGRILKSDTGIAKNYLDEKQIKSLERNVSSYLDYIEDLIERRTNFTMEDCAQSIDNFLAFREYQVLDGYGKVSMKEAKSAASQEYDAFNKTQKIISDFDKQTKNLK
ncbi:MULTISPECIES: virulence RhuM family protein [unclassified Lactococcus]|uniref:virulence RhuM family protein n=1 Tax=unclassified Lactococcus TaxID=2643510 RepID=UPI001E4BB019|nr:MULTISPECIES: virulence RhuM family protein [unclassified Lactococcus]